MKVLVASTLVVACLAGCAPAPEPGKSSPSVVGSWRLEEWTVGEGVPRCSAEEGGASGQIMYSADGHMSAQLGCAGLSQDEASADPEAAIGRMIRRHFSYYGTYAVDEVAQTVTHHVLGSVSAAWVGTDRVRSYVFEGPDRIVLSPAESDNRLVWARN
jgi:hypothetical protein